MQEFKQQSTEKDLVLQGSRQRGGLVNKCSLKERIEHLRRELNRLINSKDLQNEEVIEKSLELDELLNQFLGQEEEEE